MGATRHSRRCRSFGFAVTSGLRAYRYRQTIEDPGILFAGYEAFKRHYKPTDRVCPDQGLRFTPVILQARGGGWSPTYRGVVDWIAKQSAAVTHKDQSAVFLTIAQCMSCSLQWEIARAVMRRQAEASDSGADSDWCNLEDVESW